MNCLHGLGPMHLIVDFLMMLPFVSVIVMWFKSKRWKPWGWFHDYIQPPRFFGLVYRDYLKAQSFGMLMPFNYVARLLIWFFEFVRVPKFKLKIEEAYKKGFEEGRR